MAPFPKPISRAAYIVETAISEGRAEEAMHKLVHALRNGEDKASRLLAADWIEAIGLPLGGAKKLRRGHLSLPEDWLDISDMVSSLQSEGQTYAQATADTAAHFGCSERHVQKCVGMWKEAERSARETE